MAPMNLERILRQVAQKSGVRKGTARFNALVNTSIRKIKRVVKVR